MLTIWTKEDWISECFGQVLAGMPKSIQGNLELSQKTLQQWLLKYNIFLNRVFLNQLRVIQIYSISFKSESEVFFNHQESCDITFSCLRDLNFYQKCYSPWRGTNYCEGKSISFHIPYSRSRLLSVICDHQQNYHLLKTSMKFFQHKCK